MLIVVNFSVSNVKYLGLNSNIEEGVTKLFSTMFFKGNFCIGSFHNGSVSIIYITSIFKAF